MFETKLNFRSLLHDGKEKKHLTRGAATDEPIGQYLSFHSSLVAIT